MQKQESIDRLKAEAGYIIESMPEECTDLVFSEGPLDARLMITGEAPGLTELREGRPFIGRAGQMLRDELLRVGLKPEEAYFTNVVKCRPVKIDKGRTTNRTPTIRETRLWADIIRGEIETVNPDVILLVGRIAAQTLIDPKFDITRQRGIWFEIPPGIPAIATFHTSYLLRLIEYGDDEKLSLFREDLKSVSGRLAELE